ncbi:MAG: hypothetical protein JWN08_2400 [Frankiales bacterium]|nr:hypothetical protein [Frankiales bacterium]
MTPLAELLPYATVTTAYAVTTADVPRESWVAAVTAVRDDGASFLDLLTAVDQSPGGFDVVVRLWSVGERYAVHVRTTCPRDDARVPTLTAVFAGAAWHERELAEMYGVAFDGHDDPAPLLLPPGGVVQGGVMHPLRKEHVLAARVEQPWPGSVDPADSGEGGRPSKRRLLPPGAT